MKWSKTTREERSILISFIVAFNLIIIVGITGGLGIGRVRQSFRDVYKNHLLPTYDIFQTVERQFDNRFHLEELVSGISVENSLELKNDVEANNKYIDSVISHYVTGHTLDPKEQKDIKDFMTAIREYRILEKRIVDYCIGGKLDSAELLFKDESYRKFQKAIVPLNKLEEDQMAISTQIFKEADDLAATISFGINVVILTSIALAIGLGVYFSKAYLSD